MRIWMSRYDTNWCMELLTTSANDHIGRKLKMFEMCWRLMATPTRTYSLTMWLLRPTNFAFLNTFLCWLITVDVWRNDKPIEVWSRASSNLHHVQIQECEGVGMVFYATWYVRYNEKTSNDTSAQCFRTKHSLLIFGVQETLYYLNVASKNRMPHFRRHALKPMG